MLRKHIPLFSYLLLILVILIGAENQFAPSFQSCISQGASQQTTKDFKEKRQFIVIGVETQIICSLRLVDTHSGFFAVLAAFCLAAFTFTLKRSTDKLWKAGERQLRAMRQSAFVNIASARAARKSADVAEAALTVAERPYLVPKEPKMKLWRYGPDSPFPAMLRRKRPGRRRPQRFLPT